MGKDLVAFEASLDANLDRLHRELRGRAVRTAAGSSTSDSQGGPTGEVSSSGYPDDL